MLKRGFIITWLLVGITISIPPFLFLIELSMFFLVISFTFLIFITIQYLTQLRFFRNSYGIGDGKKYLLTQFKKEVLFSFAVGLIQVFIISITGYFALPASYDFKMLNIYALCIGLLQPFLLIFLHRLFYLIQQNTFLKKEVHSFQKLSKITQKKTLQDLVSPHFLFNSLNTVASITSENQDEAIEFVEKLSDLYEFILKNNENQLIELSEELEIVEKYGFLIQTRFGDFFNLKIKISQKHLSSKIPPLTIQNLVENAIKRNSVTRKKPLKVIVEVDNGYVKVENNINPKKTLKSESTKLGLSYIKNQVHQFSSKEVRVIQKDGVFRVDIPLINH